MNVRQVQKLLKDTDFVHESGTPEELKVAELLKAQSEATGAQVHLEPFDVEMTTIRSAGLTADGTEYPCKGYRLCGSGTVEAPFLYLSSDWADNITQRESNNPISARAFFMIKGCF